MADQTYDDSRARRLEGLIRALGDRIRQLDERGAILANSSELTSLIGDVRSELFHYEVRATYDTPEVAEHRRIVREARDDSGDQWHKTGWTPNGDSEPPEW